MARVNLIALATVLAAALPAQAARAPNARERAAILRVAPHPAYRHGTYRRVVRVSTVSVAWAAVYIAPTRGHAREVQADVASFSRRRGRWHLHQVGNGGGCHMPRAVRRDLRLACY